MRLYEINHTQTNVHANMPRGKATPVEIIEEVLQYYKENDDSPGTRQYKPEEGKLFTCAYAMRIFGQYWNNVISCAELEPKTGSSMIERKTNCKICEKEFVRKLVKGSDLTAEPLNICSLKCMKIRWPKFSESKKPKSKVKTVKKVEKDKNILEEHKEGIDTILTVDKKFYQYSEEEDKEKIKDGITCPGPLCKKTRNRNKFYIIIEDEGETTSTICMKCQKFEQFKMQTSKHKLLKNKILECKQCYLCDKEVNESNINSFFLKVKSKSMSYVQENCLSLDISSSVFRDIINKGLLFCRECGDKKD